MFARAIPPTCVKLPPMNQPLEPSGTTAATLAPAPEASGIARSGWPVPAVGIATPGPVRGPTTLKAPPT